MFRYKNILESVQLIHVKFPQHKFLDPCHDSGIYLLAFRCGGLVFSPVHVADNVLLAQILSSISIVFRRQYQFINVPQSVTHLLPLYIVIK